MTKTAQINVFVLCTLLLNVITSFCFAQEVNIHTVNKALSSSQANRSKNDNKPIKILVMEGGGIYGILSSAILSEIEKTTHKPLSELFDVMVGSSTGAIQIALLNKPKPNTREPMYSAKDVYDFYLKYGAEILNISLYRKIVTLGGVISPILSKDNLKKRLIEKLGEFKLKEALTLMLVPAYDINTLSLLVFNSYAASLNNIKLVDVLLAAAAIPNIIAAHPIKIKNKAHYFTDATVIANNPLLIGISTAKRLFLHKKIIIVSIGVGDVLPPCDPEKQGKHGLSHMLSNWMMMLYKGSSHTHDNILQQVMNSKMGPLKKFYRINPLVSKSIGSPLDVSARNIKLLKYAANSYITTHQAYFKEIAASLTN